MNTTKSKTIEKNGKRAKGVKFAEIGKNAEQNTIGRQGKGVEVIFADNKVKNATRQKLILGDPILIFALVLLCVSGCIFVYSASNYVCGQDYGDKYFMLKKQLVGYFIGWAGFAFFSFFDHKKLKKYSLLLYIIGVILLILVLTPLGKKVYGAKRWIGLGPVTIQPSEIARLAFVIFVSAYFSADMSRVKTFKGILPVLAAGSLLCLLIIAEPNMSVTICVGAVMVAMLFISCVPFKILVAIFIPALLALPILIIIEPYRLKRLYAFLDPWSSPKGEGYQLIQSLYALSSGGLFGTGLFKSRQKLRFLPFAESDFILSIVGEETGFFGIIFLFFICFSVIMSVIKTSKNSDNFYDYLLCEGIMLIFVIQIAVNALVVTGSIPPTGIPFPLLSSGNTQIITFLSAFGIVNNVYRQNKRK